MSVWLAVLMFLANPQGQAPLDSDLAGVYVLGDGTGLNWDLELLPSGVFNFTWEGCMGTYAELSGKWHLRDDAIELEVTKREEKLETSGLSAPFRVVRWGPRIYLVPNRLMDDFCRSISNGWEPRKDALGEFFLRQADWTKPSPGSPAIPTDVACSTK